MLKRFSFAADCGSDCLDKAGGDGPGEGGQFASDGDVNDVGGLALDHREIVPPVIDCLPWLIMRSCDNPPMLAQDLSFGGDHDAFGVDP